MPPASGRRPLGGPPPPAPASVAAPRRLAVVDEAWRGLVTAGPTLNSAERQAVMAAARAAWSRTDSGWGDVLTEAAFWLARDAGGITGEVVEDLEDRGLDRFRYLEAVGVVARLAAVDFYDRGLGREARPLPGDDGSSPTGEVDPNAAITNGWVPATGPLWAPASLDALPSEGSALRSLHHELHLPMDQLGDPEHGDVMSRPQIDFVAARTSFLNECFHDLLGHARMLQASTQAAGIGVDIAAVITDTAPSIDHGASLLALTDSLTVDTDRRPEVEWTILAAAAGPAVAERAVGVCAGAQMMNRVIGGVGAPVSPSLHAIAAELGFEAAELSPR